MTERYSTDFLRQRLRGDHQPAQTALHLATRSAAPDAARDGHRERSRSVDLDEEVARSVEAIERTVENFGALRDNICFYKDTADDLRQDLHREKEQNKEMLKQLAAMDSSLKDDRERAMNAETCAEDFGLVVRDLERQLDKLRSQTVRMVKAVSILMSTDRDAESHQGQEGSRSAA